MKQLMISRFNVSISPTFTVRQDGLDCTVRTGAGFAIAKRVETEDICGACVGAGILIEWGADDRYVPRDGYREAELVAPHRIECDRLLIFIQDQDAVRIVS